MSRIFLKRAISGVWGRDVAPNGGSGATPPKLTAYVICLGFVFVWAESGFSFLRMWAQLHFTFLDRASFFSFVSNTGLALGFLHTRAWAALHC